MLLFCKFETFVSYANVNSVVESLKIQ